MEWLWLAVPVLVLAFGYGLYRAARDPRFIAGITSIVVKAAIAKLKPSFKKIWASKTPEEWQKLREKRRQEERSNK